MARRTRKRGPSLNPDRMGPPLAEGDSAVSPHIEIILGIPINMSEFAQPANDGHGHSAPIRVNFLPGHAVEAENIVASKRWPYRNAHDLIRHAVARHLKWLNILFPSPTVLTQVEAMLEVLREEQFLLDFETIFTQTQQLVGRHVAARQMGMALTLLEKLRDEIGEMPEGAWREKYAGMFEERFGALLEGEGGEEGIEAATGLLKMEEVWQVEEERRRQ